MKSAQIKDIVKVAGGPSVIGRELGVSASAVNNWMSRGHIPAEHCPTLERLTGGKYRCEQMRPDVEWSVLRGTSPISSSTGASTP